MSTQTLLHNILMLSYADRQFIAEQVSLSLNTDKSIMDNTQNFKELSAAKIPEGYISLGEFRREGHKIIHKFCVENGIN